jgi:branched-chain amino acid transport system substrate-binding protein
MNPSPHATLRRQLLALVPASAALGLAALRLPRAQAADAAVSGAEILIGQSITLQGGRNAYGEQVQAGIKAWLDELARSGGIFGRRIQLRTLDDDNDAAKAEANARALVANGAFVLFGSIEGGPSLAVMKVAVELGVPFIGPMAGSPGLRRPHQPLVFPVRAEHREEFRALMTHGASIGLRRVALFHADSATGREHLANVEALAATLKMDVGGGLPFKSDVSDGQLDAMVGELAKRSVDLVINHGSPAVYERLIRRARALGSKLQFWGVNSGSSAMAASLGALAHGMVFSQVLPNPNSGKTALAREFQQHHQRLFPDKPFTYGGMEGFMTAKALTLALKAAGPRLSRTSLLAALQNFEADLGGVKLSWRKGEHIGSPFVDLALVGRDGRFVQ